MKFTCPDCGGHELDIVEENTLARSNGQFTSFRKIGNLIDHDSASWEWLEDEEIESWYEEDEDEGDRDEEDIEIKTIDIEFFVVCSKCEKEIPFGWSHSGCAGRIWPAFTDDFEPGKSWPDPKYKKFGGI